MSDVFDGVVVGAGMAGLIAARRLQQQGRRVVVLDKGRGVGGRMATRRFEDSICDHGAQFMTVRSAAFRKQVEEWQAAGLVREWFRRTDGVSDSDAGHPRYCATNGMTAIPKQLAADLEVRLKSPVQAVSVDHGKVRIDFPEGPPVVAHTAILTPPVPQTLALLEAGSISLPTDLGTALAEIAYAPCFAVMARLDGPSGLPAPGTVSGTQAPIAWIADNQQKGISSVPAITIHADAEFSRHHWTLDRNEVGRLLIEQAKPFLSANVIETQVHGWRYSQPVTTFPESFAVVSESPLVVLAGDAFQGPRVEGAALSGLAAAERLLGG